MGLLPIGFQDANFECSFAWGRSEIEGVHRRWIPFGMPRLNPVFSRMVVFLYGRNAKTGKIEGPCGTGFLVGVERQDGGYGYMAHAYAITAHHGIKDGASILRVNTQDGRSRFIELEPHEWHFLAQRDDIAAADVTDHIIKSDDDFSVLPLGLLATREFLARAELGIGEDGFMLGLFADHHGQHRNRVAARFGNISLLATDDDPISQPNGRMRPSHLFDMRSRPGFSGSPVFVYRTPSGDLRDLARGPMPRRVSTEPWSHDPIRDVRGGALPPAMTFLPDARDHENTFIRLLGVHVSQYHDTVVARKISSGGRQESDKNVRDGDKLKIPNSMAVVVPAWSIIDLLNVPAVVEQREKREIEMKKADERENPAQPERVAPKATNSVEAKTPNPRHKKDFRGLLNAAAKKKPQGG